VHEDALGGEVKIRHGSGGFLNAKCKMENGKFFGLPFFQER